MQRRDFLQAIPACILAGYFPTQDNLYVSGNGWSQKAINNCNKLLKTLKETTSIESPYELLCHENVAAMIVSTLTTINGVPMFSFYSLEDTEFVDSAHNLLVHGVSLMWRAMKDQSIYDRIPTASEICKSEVSEEYSLWLDRVKRIKSERHV